MTPAELKRHIASKAKEKRLALNFSQKSLAERSGVSLGVLKKFEHSGDISLISLLKLALPLDALSEFNQLFHPRPLESYLTLDAIIANKKRKRGRG
jgi:transcriptional regulator with XRE-family HTH domain